jgi:hypothetical protein
VAEPVTHREPGWAHVLTIAALVVAVVLGAAVLTSLLPPDAQRLVFRTRA